MLANRHEEADCRLCVHADDAVYEGATSVLVRTVDTDVVVILVGIFHDLAQHHQEMQLSVGFGTGHFRYYHINKICQELGEDKAPAFSYLEKTKLPHFLYFTPSLVPIPHPGSTVKAKSQPG